MKPKTHPLADMFPRMTPAELDALTADIAANGLRHPIILYHGAILDGRNRLAACEKAGKEPAFVEHQGDEASAKALVISLNVQRRDLTPGQRAVVAARCMVNTPLTRPGRKELACQFKIGENALQEAAALLKEAPDLLAGVEAGGPLAPAYATLQERRQQAAQKAKDMRRIADYAEYGEALARGDMTFEEALQKAFERDREKKQKEAIEADARGTWLKRLIEVLEWIEMSVADREDDYLEWYNLKGSPGHFDHGITPERIARAVAQLARLRVFALAGHPAGRAAPDAASAGLGKGKGVFPKGGARGQKVPPVRASPDRGPDRPAGAVLLGRLPQAGVPPAGEAPHPLPQQK
jgi:ParB-like chromosome segregation protein Spo0J